MRVKLKDGFSNKYVVKKKEYTVFAMYFGSNVEYLIDAEGFPSAPYGAREDEFEVIDPRLSKYWVYGEPVNQSLSRAGRVAILAFPEWVDDLSFFQSLVDGKNGARTKLEDYKRKMEAEFAPSYIKKTSLKLSNYWVQCIECENVWQLKLVDELVICPSCGEKQLNPHV